MLSLVRTTRESIALCRVIQQERIDWESQELNRLRLTLLADAALVGTDREAMHRLSLRIATFYQRVGALERTVEALLRNAAPGVDLK